jgi:hypothetical protein
MRTRDSASFEALERVQEVDQVTGYRGANPWGWFLK